MRRLDQKEVSKKQYSINDILDIVDKAYEKVKNANRRMILEEAADLEDKSFTKGVVEGLKMVLAIVVGDESNGR